MISQGSIEQFVETRSSTCREIFSSLIANPSQATQQALEMLAAKKVLQYIKSAKIEVGQNWQADLSKIMSIEELFLIVEAENQKEANAPLVKLLGSKLTRPILNIVIGYVLDINLNALPIAQQFEAGDGVFLAALYQSFASA